MSEKGLTRKEVLVGGVGAAAVLALGGTVKAFAGEGAILRPPGGQDEARLLGACIRCDRCRSACPLDVISVANGQGLINTRTPRLDFRIGYCNFCNLCIEACPTGALAAFDPDREWIGPAVIDYGECLAFNKAGGCRICVDECPYQAIYLNERQEPVVDLPKCNGCGYCEYICPSHKFRSFSGSRKRGINIEHSKEVRP
ncbi:MAG: 4Fe-4S dicluster domain-containing protein [Coriobacteriaceae bacterium]|jgi:ferredoxin-type protein NapG|nr:4Fe-4S dicluster domain-containing protein [Coriobacteriaceae bacterium]